MTLQAQRIALGAQQVLVVAAVRLVAGGTALSEGRLMQMRFLELVSLLAVAGQAGIDRIGLDEARSLAGVRIVAGDAFSLRAGMLHLRLLDLLSLLGVASHAERLGIGLRQHDLAVLRRLVADVAGAAGERRMRELLHQLRLRRLVRIVTLNAIGGGERLPLVRLDQAGIFHVVAVDAQRRSGFGQVIIELQLARLARLVDGVASLAAHVQRGVPAAFLWNVESLRVAGEAKVLALIAGGRLQQLELVVGLVRVVTLKAIAHSRRMDLAFEVGGILVGVAGDAQRLRRGGDQLDASDVFVDADLMTTGAAHGDGGVNILAFGLVFMALDALRRIGILVEWNWMGGRASQGALAIRTRPRINRTTFTAISHPNQPVWSTSRTAVRPVAIRSGKLMIRNGLGVCRDLISAACDDSGNGFSSAFDGEIPH